MGNCVSSHKRADMKRAVQTQSPNTNQDTLKKEQHIAVPRTAALRQVDSFRVSSGCEEEAFFDSHLWLDSDCEDYFSVNGDTPSLGNTPIHQKSFIGSPKPQLGETPHAGSEPHPSSKPSPPDTKKQLFELFRESFDNRPSPTDADENFEGHNEGITSVSPLKSTWRSPFSRSRETTPFRFGHHRKGSSVHSAQCCIPNFMRSLSFSERRKRLSPGPADTNTNRW